MSSIRECRSIADLVGLLTPYLTIFASHLPTISLIFAFVFFFPIRSALDGNPLLDFVPIVLLPFLYLFGVQPAFGIGLLVSIFLAVVFLLDIASELNVSAWWVTYYLIVQAALGWFTSYGWYGFLGAICLVRYLNHGAWGLARLALDGIGYSIVMRIAYASFKAHTRRHDYSHSPGVVSAVVSQLLALDWTPDFDGFNAYTNSLVLRLAKATVTVAQNLTGKLCASFPPPHPRPLAPSPRPKSIPTEAQEKRADAEDDVDYGAPDPIEQVLASYEAARREDDRLLLEEIRRAERMELSRPLNWLEEKARRTRECTRDTLYPATRAFAPVQAKPLLWLTLPSPAPAPFQAPIPAPVSAPVPVPIMTPVSAPVPELVPEVVYPVISQVPELAPMVVGPIETPVNESLPANSKTLDGRVTKPVNKPAYAPSFLSTIRPLPLADGLDRILPTRFGNGAPVIGCLPSPMEGVELTPAQPNPQDLAPGPMLIDEPDEVRETRHGIMLMSIQSEDDMDTDAFKPVPSAGLRPPPRYGFPAIVQQIKQAGWQPTAKVEEMPQGPQQAEASSSTTKPEGPNTGFADFKPLG
ncbi:hypothetical protein K449DRAFT_432598, partial [Hypoxylon sp. EC38]